jgi:hypothetical protein
MGLAGQKGQFPRKLPTELFRNFKVASKNSGNIISGIFGLLAVSLRTVESLSFFKYSHQSTPAGVIYPILFLTK